MFMSVCCLSLYAFMFVWFVCLCGVYVYMVLCILFYVCMFVWRLCLCGCYTCLYLRSYDLYVCMSCMSVFVLLYSVDVVCVCFCVGMIFMSVQFYPCMMFVCMLSILYGFYVCMIFKSVCFMFVWHLCHNEFTIYDGLVVYVQQKLWGSWLIANIEGGPPSPSRGGPALRKLEHTLCKPWWVCIMVTSVAYPAASPFLGTPGDPDLIPPWFMTTRLRRSWNLWEIQT